jgi:cytochrome c-type biogenesis protein CcsB
MVLRELHRYLFQNRLSCHWLGWMGLIALSILAVGVVEYWETDILTPAIPVDQLSVFKLGGYAHLVLVAATALYVWNLWSGADLAGRWASRLTGVGAIGLVLSLVTRWIETYYLHRPAHVPLNAMYEMMALFSAITVVFYIVMECVYRTRMAGAFVMTIVLAAMSFQVWLIGSGQAIVGTRIPVLRDYQMYAHVLGHFVGYGAFAVSAAMGAAYLMRLRAEGTADCRRMRSQNVALRALPDLSRIEQSMHSANALGFALYGVATVLGALWAYQAWGRYWAWEPKEIWVLLVWLIYGTYFFFRYTQRWSGERLAWWSIIGFLITVVYYLGVRAWWPGLHSTYG